VGGMSGFVRHRRWPNHVGRLTDCGPRCGGRSRARQEVIEQVLVCLVAGGHVLIEDLPGLGKTTLAYALARSTDCAFLRRVQFTSDLPAEAM